MHSDEKYSLIDMSTGFRLTVFLRYWLCCRLMKYPLVATRQAVLLFLAFFFFFFFSNSQWNFDEGQLKGPHMIDGAAQMVLDYLHPGATCIPYQIAADRRHPRAVSRR